MGFCIVCFLRRFHSSYRETDSGQQYPFISDVATELEDSRKFSLNSLTVLLAVLAISGSKTLQSVVLILLIYTISLRVAINTCFLRNYPTLTRFLHAIPMLGTCCTASVVLITDSKSPTLAAVGLLIGVSPLVTIAIHHGRSCSEAPVTELPLRMQDVSAPTASSSASTTPSD